jgi:hypothetical protein
MRGRIWALKIEIDSETRKLLQGWRRRQKTPIGLAKRAHGMLLLADGQTYSYTSKQVGLSEPHLRKWAKRFIELGVRGLYDRKRPGRPPSFSPSSGIVSGEVSL